MDAKTAYLLTGAMIVLMKIVCFILGYLTIKLGYNLISSGVKGKFKFSTKLAGFRADLASVSPGLLFVLLGIMLIGFAIYTDKEIELKEGGQSVNFKEDQYIPPVDPFDTITNTLNITGHEEDINNE